MSGATQAVREDFLDEDPEISGQRFVLLSFISPEAVLQRKEQFLFQKFLVDYEVEYKVKNLEQFLGNTVLQINRKLDECADAAEQAGNLEAAKAIREKRVPVDNIMDQYQTFIKKNKKEITRTTIEEAYKDFLFRHQEKLEAEFHEANQFQTTVRGLKIRGVYATTQEASVRAKKLVRSDPIHNILVGEVGKWLPWDPTPNGIKEQEYAEEQLNQLMGNYKKNQDNLDDFYRQTGLKRPEKRVFGATDEGAGAAAGAPENTISGPGGAGAAGAGDYKGLFDTQGDLALQRKMEAAKIDTSKKDE